MRKEEYIQHLKTRSNDQLKNHLARLQSRAKSTHSMRTIRKIRIYQRLVYSELIRDYYDGSKTTYRLMKMEMTEATMRLLEYTTNSMHRRNP